MMSIVEATRKKKSQAMSLTSLPEEIIEIILARVSRWDYPKLSLVSKTFHSLLTSNNIYKTRSEMGTTETFLYICLESSSDQSNQWFTLRAKPNRVRARTITKQFRRRSSGNVLIPTIPSCNRVPVPACYTIAVGSEIYIMGESSDGEPSSTVWVLDCRSHTWRNAPNMKVARQDANAVSLDGKIYVMGGCKSIDQFANWVEVFDIKNQSWTSLPSPCNMSYESLAVSVVQGKLHVMTDWKDYTYDPKQDTWKVVRETFISDELTTWCVVENIICCCVEGGDCMWYDTESGKCEMIKGLEILREHPQHGLSTWSVHNMINYGGNLLVIWDSKLSHKKTKFWYAEISLETRCKGSEVWGNIEWVDVMCTPPHKSYDTLDCFNVSV